MLYLAFLVPHSAEKHMKIGWLVPEIVPLNWLYLKISIWDFWLVLLDHIANVLHGVYWFLSGVTHIQPTVTVPNIQVFSCYFITAEDDYGRGNWQLPWQLYQRPLCVRRCVHNEQRSHTVRFLHKSTFYNILYTCFHSRICKSIFSKGMFWPHLIHHFCVACLSRKDT